MSVRRILLGFRHKWRDTPWRMHILQLSICDRSRRTHSFMAAIVGVLLLPLNLSVLAQDSSPATIVSGTVRNAAGEPVADVAVSLQGNGQSPPISTKTNADGAFSLSAPRSD